MGLRFFRFWHCLCFKMRHTHPRPELNDITLHTNQWISKESINALPEFRLDRFQRHRVRPLRPSFPFKGFCATGPIGAAPVPRLSFPAFRRRIPRPPGPGGSLRDGPRRPAAGRRRRADGRRPVPGAGFPERSGRGQRRHDNDLHGAADRCQRQDPGRRADDHGELPGFVRKRQYGHGREGFHRGERYGHFLPGRDLEDDRRDRPGRYRSRRGRDPHREVDELGERVAGALLEDRHDHQRRRGFPGGAPARGPAVPGPRFPPRSGRGQRRHDDDLHGAADRRQRQDPGQRADDHGELPGVVRKRRLGHGRDRLHRGERDDLLRARRDLEDDRRHRPGRYRSRRGRDLHPEVGDALDQRAAGELFLHRRHRQRRQLTG